MTHLAPYLSRFLMEYLPRDRGASRHTIDSYAYSFQLLVAYAAKRLKTRPSDIQIEQVGAELILDFLDHIESDRANMPRTRNARLAAFKSFYRFLEYRAPTCLGVAQQVHAIPSKRIEQPVVDYLTRAELQVLLDVPDRRTASGIRDRAMLHLAYAAGLRVSELVGLRLDDLEQPAMDAIHVLGKGRRERVLPLWKETQSVLQDWLQVRPDSKGQQLFLNARGDAITRHGFASRLAAHIKIAQKAVPTLARKRVTPHVLRHTCAIHTLEATGDIRRVALWLGHSSVLSTEIYLRIDPAQKLDILDASAAPQIRKGSFNGVSDRLLAMLAVARTP
ncbi:tyrosine-type recombinase/integrase [Pseudomonas aeruginosa]|uniref:tyrosine-type recombinase/integrase n=1 Tax=Pseudomonas aeruginosa TaxID=287 RepID=UPI0023584581|nr:tyrosine-type recombinase/integrase [Pseudomonas aeruginosa]MDE8657662.1 tyrosine-type recombinase/integrase [Pseudomonas aeruginosa]MDE8663401.1 tyrosine-type recombinase/integrase [Pseudomonas aeruginosa]HBO4445834.1 tyrosine-type recombinase/integrase [Pseudomonas aeruginosa]